MIDAIALPFETPEEQQDEESPYGTWGTPQQDEDRNAGNTDDPWNTRDPWGVEQDDRSYGDSDWARDFYDSDDENSGGESDSDKGSAERVGDGPMMNRRVNSCSECGSDEVCCQQDNGKLQCRDENKSCGNNETPIPLPGIVYLLLAGLGYGGYRLRDRHTA
ncbi:MAG: hypothetical protein R6U20_10570 [Longimonas sp.]|uniref:hypothetical protein n=1 Tax=Longimonas sp. TaxID=2039626 RepID=UPI00397705DE